MPANVTTGSSGEQSGPSPNAQVCRRTHSLRAAFAVHYLETSPGEVESLKELLGHRSILTTQLYLRRLDLCVAMERVRSLDWSELRRNRSMPCAKRRRRDSNPRWRHSPP